MKKGGTGGAKTNETGLKFEKETSLAQALEQAGFEIRDLEILMNGKQSGLMLGQHKLYRFLDAENVDWKNIVSKKLLPDEAVLSSRSKQLTVVEKKWQQTQGSVDEKLQTCGFKLRQYKKLMAPIGVNVKFVYLLSDWFADPSYADVLDYIREVGADYHFKSLPLELLDL